MNKLGRSIVAVVLFAGTLALGSCADDTNSNGTSGVFGNVVPGISIGLGTDNLIESLPPFNRKTWAAVVTDASGNPVSGVIVRFALRPGRFQKGFLFVPAPPAVQAWNVAVLAICANEDVNFNNIIDPGEDLNGSGALEPVGAATVNSAATTDASGTATAVITYPKNHAIWTELILEARTTTASDPPAFATFILPGLAADYADIAISPPGSSSPYGDTSGSCLDTL